MRVVWVRAVLCVASMTLLSVRPASTALVGIDLNGNPQVNGPVTRDTNTGLEWLDLTQSTGLSYNQIVNGIGNTFFADGWRYATTAEMCLLWETYAYAPSPCPNSASLNLRENQGNLVTALLDNLGITFVYPSNQLTSGSGMFEDGDAGSGGPFEYSVGLGEYTYSVLNNRNNVQVREDAVWTDFAQPAQGHFLVRTALQYCGDAAVQPAFGEECDDGNATPGDGCDENCILEVCGNGVVQVGEECDDGNIVGGDGCDASCLSECQDVDGDGFGFPGIWSCTNGSATDCDDWDATIYPGPEINDGIDNQCPGDPGAGLVDEVTGGLFTIAGIPDTFFWTAQAGATAYQMLRSTSLDFIGDCTVFDASGTSETDPENPLLGQTFYYIIRATFPSLGSWGEDQFGVERFPICDSEFDCSDGQDNDGDGDIDCEDSDCTAGPFPLCPTFQFQDTLGDDLVPTALFDFFSSIAWLGSSDYLFFEIIETVGAKAWCAEGADFYRDSYLALASTSGSAISGPWPKWHRSPATGNLWIGPDFSGYSNRFGSVCSGQPFDWCSEDFLGGLHLGVRPGLPTVCEAFQSDSGCGAGDWVLSIRVGPDRFAACGF